MSSVLYDLPGPRAQLRNRIVGIVTLLVVIALLGFVIYRFWYTNQFSAAKWKIFSFPLVQEKIVEAIGATLLAFVLGAVLAMVLGLVLAIGRLSDHAWVRVPSALLVEFFRSIPLLILMMVLYYGLPPLGLTFVTPLIAVVTALAVYNGAVIAEIFRAGILALPKGQREAAAAIGLRKSQTMLLILLPQAIRSMMPVLLAQLVVILKDTALGFIVTYQELLYLAKFYGSSFLYGSPIIPSAIVMGSIYIALCLILSGIAKLVERRLRKAGRRIKVDDAELEAIAS